MECTRCKHTPQNSIELLGRSPTILILHMKQFKILGNHSSIKLNANLKWIYYLDISKFTSDEGIYIYELYSYVIHVGNSNSGHYTSVVKKDHLIEGKQIWVRYDDDRTEIIEE